MNYEKARVYLEEISKYGSGLGLKIVKTVLPSSGLCIKAGKGGRIYG